MPSVNYCTFALNFELQASFQSPENLKMVVCMVPWRRAIGSNRPIGCVTFGHVEFITRKVTDGLLPKLQQPLPMTVLEKGKFPLLADSTSTRGCPKAAARVISTRSRNPWLDFSLFRNFQRVIHLDAEVSDRTFQFGMAKQ